MNKYTYAVIETITRERRYVVHANHANHADEARELAEGGETVDEWTVKELEVSERDVRGLADFAENITEA